MNRWRQIIMYLPGRLAKTLLVLGLVLALLYSRGDADSIAHAAFQGPFKGRFGSPDAAKVKVTGKIAEASPPIALQELRRDLENYQPQVTILSPRKNDVVQDTTVSVRFQVRDLPIFKDERLGLGPHLHVLVDNKPYQAVYDVSQPLVLSDLEPGTHTIRAFASRPWHESFKNEGAYAQTTFHVFAKTQANQPDPALPLLTYSRPQGSYGAEPILLDFYLTNAPLHLVAQVDTQDDIADWRIRCTVNGDSFLLDRWQPIYLKGLKPGKNWVQLEYLDEQGNPVPNVFNNTVRLVTYEPNGQDTLSQLVRGDLTAAEARGIVDPNYVPPAPEPEPEATPEPESELEATPAPELESEPEPTPAPSLMPTPTPSITSSPTPTPALSPSPTPTAPAAATEQPPTPESSPDVETIEPRPAPVNRARQPKLQSWAERFRQFQKSVGPSPAPSQAPAAVPEPIESPVAPEPSATVESPAPEPSPIVPEVLSAPATPTIVPEVPTNEAKVPVAAEAPAMAPDPLTPTPPATSSGWSNFSRLTDRFRRPTPSPTIVSPPVSTPSVPTPDLPSTLPEIIDGTAPEPLADDDQ